MSNKLNRLRLAKLLMQFGEIETDKGQLIYEGELIEGTEVFIEKEGELVVAEDGEYKIEGKTLEVKDGVIVTIKEDEVQEDPTDPIDEPTDEAMEDEVQEDPTEPTVAELEEKIAELEAVIVEKDARIAELEAMLNEREEQLKMSVAKPAHKEIKEIVISNKENKALRYFEK